MIDHPSTHHLIATVLFQAGEWGLLKLDKGNKLTWLPRVGGDSIGRASRWGWAAVRADSPAWWGIERVCSSSPVEAETMHVSDHEQKSQGPMCSVELGKNP